jgi:hypothetical protein
MKDRPSLLAYHALEGVLLAIRPHLDDVEERALNPLRSASSAMLNRAVENATDRLTLSGAAPALLDDSALLRSAATTGVVGSATRCRGGHSSSLDRGQLRRGEKGEKNADRF